MLKSIYMELTSCSYNTQAIVIRCILKSRYVDFTLLSYKKAKSVILLSILKSGYKDFHTNTKTLVLLFMLKLIHVDMISFSYKNKDYSLSFYAKINFYVNYLIFMQKPRL